MKILSYIGTLPSPLRGTGPEIAFAPPLFCLRHSHILPDAVVFVVPTQKKAKYSNTRRESGIKYASDSSEGSIELSRQRQAQGIGRGVSCFGRAPLVHVRVFFAYSTPSFHTTACAWGPHHAETPPAAHLRRRCAKPTTHTFLRY